MAKNAEVEASYSGRIRATKIFRTIICVLLCIISVLFDDRELDIGFEHNQDWCTFASWFFLTVW